MSLNGPVFLLSPPPSDPTHPYSSLPYLTGFLRSFGFPVVQKDLGIHMFDVLMTAHKLEEARNEAISRLNDENESDQDYKERFYQIIGLSDFIIRHVDEAKTIMRSPEDFYNLKKYNWASSLIKMACDLISLPKHPTYLTPYDCDANVKLTFKDLLEATSQSKDNLYFDMLNSEIVPDILSTDPLMVGISVTYDSQVVPAFTLSRLLKLSAPDLHVTIGGATISLLEPQIMNDPSCFQFADSYVIGEGESALLTIAENLRSDRDWKMSPNTITRVDGKPQVGSMWEHEKWNELPPPDFDGLELEKYLSPEPVLLIMSSRGCYYGRCAFCNVSMNTRQKHRSLEHGRTASLIRHLHAKYRAERFIFGDDAVPIANMLEVAKLVMNELPSVTWAGEARLENGLTNEIIADLRQGGCRELTFGLESASQRVLDLMNKNNTIENDNRILKACKEVGLAVNIQTIIGFPSETKDEAWKTINCIIDNKTILTSFGFSIFRLFKDIPVFKNPGQYGIKIVPLEDEGEFIQFFKFEQTKGMTREDVDKIYEEASGLFEGEFGGRIDHLCRAGGAHILLHLSRYSCDELFKIEGQRIEEGMLEELFDDGTVVRIPPHILFSHPYDNGHNFKHRALNIKTGEQYELSPEEQKILELCDGDNTIEDIIDIWTKEMSNRDERTVNLARALIFINEIYKNGLVVEE